MWLGNLECNREDGAKTVSLMGLQHEPPQIYGNSSTFFIFLDANREARRAECCD